MCVHTVQVIVFCFLILYLDDSECPNAESLVFQMKSLGSYFRGHKAALAMCFPLEWWCAKGGKHVTTFIEGTKPYDSSPLILS